MAEFEPECMRKEFETQITAAAIATTKAPTPAALPESGHDDNPDSLRTLVRIILKRIQDDEAVLAESIEGSLLRDLSTPGSN
ncbi:hypothetical protein MMC07_000518 [Pseudocyphellaria aurata]|nr:hypothetical protein [Pseudocyphellaria aurata]